MLLWLSEAMTKLLRSSTSLPAVTRLTVYRRRPVLSKQSSQDTLRPQTGCCGDAGAAAVRVLRLPTTARLLLLKPLSLLRGAIRETRFYVRAALVETAVYLCGTAVQGRARLCGRCCAVLQQRSQALARGCQVEAA